MFAVPTVRVAHATAPGGFVIINESDLGADHVLWTPAPAAGNVAPIRVGKGPRGKWYVWRGQDRIAGPFDAEADALNAKSGT